ncbi:hypothetical protein Trydic_g13561, partial [Trypoxylus dichotomus]
CTYRATSGAHYLRLPITAQNFASNSQRDVETCRRLTVIYIPLPSVDRPSLPRPGAVSSLERFEDGKIVADEKFAVNFRLRYERRSTRRKRSQRSYGSMIERTTLLRMLDSIEYLGKIREF